ncbi:MAG TPA: DNA mismatch repair endonuclease MutL [Gemmatimonadaceae bacterium]|nr:DNA mismatch repair endonuclease MutL [Gemmatimonadaceae bacterium]
MSVASPPRIAVLPSAVADQIAAGEVVERPASVVKELIENALDAGATSIEIAIEDGGRQTIRVSDDGCGMSAEDAVLALERHATSKIRTAQDLVGVRSFGFRGEALAAISSVSQLELETAPDDGAGTSVRAAGGAVLEVAPIARRRGTTIRVTRLFYNAPARLKFLRGARSEWRAILDVVGSMALTRRDVRVALTHDGKPMLSLPASTALRDRLAAVYGGSFAGRLLEVDDVSGTTHVAGLVERPADVGTATRRVFLSVNGRAVRDTGLVRAAEAAYRSTIPAGVRPTLFLDVTVAADAVDVNVHPAKAEVRFRDRWPIERTVENAVRRALGTFDAGATIGRSVWSFAAPVASEPPAAPPPVDVEALHPESAPAQGLFEIPEVGERAPEPETRAAAPAPAPAPAAADVPPLTQLHRTYLMFEHEQGVVLIDQHSAHERVLYERFMGTLERGEAPAQRLLFPMTLHLGPAESDAFERDRALFEQLGFEIDGFGGHTLIVRAVPMPHPRFDPERCVRETLAALTGDRESGVHARHERLAATVACKAAIKAGDLLSPGEMRALFVALRDTRLPAHDVHGRATIVQLTWDEIERRFGRR